MRSVATIAVLLTAVYIAWCFYDPFDPKTDLKDKRVVVCGASTGIGEEIAYLYARAGAKIVLAARRISALEKVQAKCRDLGAAQVEIFPGDLSLMNTSKAIVEHANEKLGGIDHLILNHIISYYTLWTSSIDLDYATKLIQIDFLSYVYLATYAMPYLEASRGGIVVVSSAAGLWPSPLTHIYAGAKHGLHGFFGSLRQDLMIQNSNISISIVPLGLFGSERALENTRTTLPDMLKLYGNTVDAAYAIARTAVLRPREYCYPYFDTKFMHWLYQFFPNLMDHILLYIFKQRN